jgi:hypothetical protein
MKDNTCMSCHFCKVSKIIIMKPLFATSKKAVPTEHLSLYCMNPNKHSIINKYYTKCPIKEYRPKAKGLTYWNGKKYEQQTLMGKE